MEDGVQKREAGKRFSSEERSGWQMKYINEEWEYD
jgi:hypothetical protein